MRNMEKVFIYLGFTLIAMFWTCVLNVPLLQQACVLDDEIDICPENMTCKLDESGHPYCHIEGNPVPNSHCLTEGEYEPYLLNIKDFSGHEECSPFSVTPPCPDNEICCRTLHGHRCFPFENATLLQTNYKGYADP